MMKMGGLLLGVACAGACAIPLVLPLLAGASFAVIGGSLLKPNWEVIACGALALLAVALLIVRPRRPRSGCSTKTGSCSIDGSCGCSPGTKPT